VAEIVATVLAGWLRERLAQESADAVSDVQVEVPRRARGGQSNDTMLIDASWHDGSRRRTEGFVIRCQPTSRQLFLDADVLREFRVIAALESHSDVPVPHALWAEPDPGVLGAPFFVMSRVAGTVPIAKPSVHHHPWLRSLTAGERRRIWDAALDCLVAIHDVDWGASHAFLVPAGERPGLDVRLARLAQWYRWACAGRPFPITDAALEHLLAARPTAAEPVLVWGDARLGNMVIADSLSVAAAIDWELAMIGPAEIDLGHWLFFDDFMLRAAAGEELDGFPGRAETIESYQQRSGRVVSDLEYYETMQAFVVAVTLIRQADLRVAAGELPADTRMAHDNAVTQILAERLGLPIPQLSADYVSHRQAPSSPDRTT
jgi:aminoglycoside phosphotransferase (APT) family kinase protein